MPSATLEMIVMAQEEIKTIEPLDPPHRLLMAPGPTNVDPRVLAAMSKPTVGQFADFLNISQSNATYKVNSLIRKGYLERQNSAVDRREYHLVLSEKFYNYAGLLSSYEMTVMERIKERFSAEDVEKFDNMLSVISKELMPECE